MAFYLSRSISQLGAQDTPETGNTGGRRVAYRIALGQLAITGICAVGFGLGMGSQAGFSALVGGAINALANLYLARRVFGAARTPQAILRNLYVGEFLKIGLTVALFVLALLTLDLVLLPLLATYAATLIGFWIALLKETAGITK